MRDYLWNVIFLSGFMNEISITNQKFFLLILLKYSLCTVLYELQVYNIAIHNSQRLFSIYSYYKNTGYISCVVQYILKAYFIHNCLYLLITYPFIFSSHFLFPTDKHKFVLYISESISLLLYSLIFYSFLISHISNIILSFFCLTHSTQHNTLQVH